jgi:hypothetical protein
LKTYNNKILLIYFLYLLFGCIFFLNFHIDEFPNKYIFTDWLINYEGGYVRRGLLGHIIFEISNFFNLKIQTIIIFFQITIYSLYFLIFYLLLSKIRINFFWLIIIFSPILFLYPLSELEALGRKDIFVISIFLIFSIINYKNINTLFLSFISLFSFSSFIHEITFFYIFHYLFVIYIKNKFLINSKIKIQNYILAIILIGVLLYLNLYQHNFVDIKKIVNSYNFEDFTTESGSFSHISPSIDSVFFKTLHNISVTSISRYGSLIAISLFPLIYFLKIKKNYENKYFNFKKIILTMILLSTPLYMLIFDWGRLIYINYNFCIIIIVLMFNLNLFDEDYIGKKLKKIQYKLKIFIFFISCLAFAPKILVTDDLASFPLYRSAIKILKIFITF